MVLGRCWYRVILRFSFTAVSRLFFALCRLIIQKAIAHKITATIIHGTMMVVLDTPPESCLRTNGRAVRSGDAVAR
ncbi:hypothetical protein BC943DRAFT_323446 [Umbelopsis sp. AD052]|nr:hypothetical protein BC943DRAFT_323446 [Umbelopsis sp. AD052]